MEITFLQALKNVADIAENNGYNAPDGIRYDETYSFRGDFSNIVYYIEPDSSSLRHVHLDIYGDKVDPQNLTAQQYAKVALADMRAYCFIEEVKALKEKSTPLPGHIHQMTEAIVAITPFEVPQTFDETAGRLIRLALALDIIKSKDFDVSPVQRKILKQAVDKLIGGLAMVFPDFNTFANNAYRDLGYFELDIFSKRITVDRLKALHEQKPNEILRALYGSEIGSIYKDIFRPRLDQLSDTQMDIIYTLIRHEGSMDEARLMEEVGGAKAGRAQVSKMRQNLAALFDCKAIKEQDGVIKIRGNEFIDWFTAVTQPRREKQRKPLISPPCDNV